VLWIECKVDHRCLDVNHLLLNMKAIDDEKYTLPMFSRTLRLGCLMRVRLEVLAVVASFECSEGQVIARLNGRYTCQCFSRPFMCHIANHWSEEPNQFIQSNIVRSGYNLKLLSFEELIKIVSIVIF
jgi:hypothetical protein